MSNHRGPGTTYSSSIDQNFPTGDKRDLRTSYFSLFNIDQTTNLESTPVSADFWVAALILGLGGVYLLIMGAFFLIQIIWVPLLLAYFASVLGFILHHGQKVAPKVRLIADTDVCQLLKLNNGCAVVLGVRNYLNEEGNPRGTYLSIKTEGSYVVDVVVPGLNEYGKIVLNRSSHVLKEVAI
ncbi:MAG: hypothetical protein H7Y22_17280, partial [Gemmatimonadaceae bacterium]|nr:hypothetical protein [Gloeobacterales cyanobacterium ES-bin-141]